MKAVVLEAPQTLIYHDDIDCPNPGPGWARVHVKAASICGSDMLRVYHGAAKIYPLILGHECAGLVESVGEGVDSAWIGRAVAIAPLISCMTCDSCQRGLYASCTRYSFIGSRIAGGFAEYLVAPVANLIPLPDALPPELGALVEPTTVALHALNRAGGVQGKQVAVFGAGSIGMLTLLMARYRQAKFVVAVDILIRNLDFARGMGIDAVLEANTPQLATSLKSLTQGGVDVAVEASGALAALEQAIYACRPGGHVVFVGNQPLDRTLPSALIEHIMRYQLNLHGAWMSYSAPFPGDEWREAVTAIFNMPDVFRAMTTHNTTLEGLPALFEQLHKREIESRKVVIYP